MGFPCINVIDVDDIDAWEAHLDSLEVEHYPRRVRPDGAQQLFLHDPDGHTIELCVPPPDVTEEAARE